MILALLVAAPSVLFANTTNFDCVTDQEGTSTHLTVQLNFKELATGGKFWTRGIVELNGPGGEVKTCVPFEVVKTYKRLGYVQTFKTKLQNGQSIVIREEAFENEGPVEVLTGELVSYAGTKKEVSLPLACTESH